MQSMHKRLPLQKHHHAQNINGVRALTVFTPFSFNFSLNENYLDFLLICERCLKKPSLSIRVGKKASRFLKSQHSSVLLNEYSVDSIFSSSDDPSLFSLSGRVVLNVWELVKWSESLESCIQFGHILI